MAYQRIVFMQGDDAKKTFLVFNNEGRDAAFAIAGAGAPHAKWEEELATVQLALQSIHHES